MLVIGTQVAVAVTGTDQFCGTTCHSHEKFVYPEHQLTAHYNNRVGVRAMCVDCHVPHSYPAKLIVKAKKGIADAYAEMRGTISTQEKFDRERWRLANKVWDEMRADNSANCRHCHDPQAMDNKKQSEDAVKQHKKFASGKATCIDCHTGIAHKEPQEPKPPTKPPTRHPTRAERTARPCVPMTDAACEHDTGYPESGCASWTALGPWSHRRASPRAEDDCASCFRDPTTGRRTAMGTQRVPHWLAVVVATADRRISGRLRGRWR